MRNVEIARMLPEVFQRAIPSSALLQAFIDVMETLHGGTERRLATIEATFDPRRCSPEFLPMLAAWTASGLYLATGSGRQREVIASAVALSQWRGTPNQLLALLRVATGTAGINLFENIDKDGNPRDFHVLVRVPSASATHEPTIRAIIESEKPAHVTYDLVIDSEKAQ
jgi:phage tail-like protein